MQPVQGEMERGRSRTPDAWQWQDTLRNQKPDLEGQRGTKTRLEVKPAPQAVYIRLVCQQQKEAKEIHR